MENLLYYYRMFIHLICVYSNQWAREKGKWIKVFLSYCARLGYVNDNKMKINYIFVWFRFGFGCILYFCIVWSILWHLRLLNVHQATMNTFYHYYNLRFIYYFVAIWSIIFHITSMLKIACKNTINKFMNVKQIYQTPNAKIFSQNLNIT